MSEILGQGYGRILAEAREAKGLSIAQVAEKLKLTGRQIEALEAEDNSRLPAPVFVRGFVRNYARLVGVSQDSLPVVSDAPVIPTETITAHSEELLFRPSPVRRWLLLPALVFVLFLILVAVLYAWLSQGEEAYVPAAPALSSQPLAGPVPAEPAPVEPLPPGAPVADPALPAPAQPAPAAPALSPSPSPAPAAAPAAVATPVPAVPGATSMPAAKPVTPPAPAPAPAPARATLAAPSQVASPSFGAPVFPAAAPAPVAAPAPASRPAHVLQLIAENTDSWVEVVAGDNKRYKRMLRSGEQLTLRGTPPFRLLVGNAAGVRLSYDGKAIDLKPYTGDKVARLNLE